jgi:hypothetical protein
MLHRDQKGVVYTRVGNITEHTGKEAGHYVKVTEYLHKLTSLNKIVEVTCQFNNLDYIVIGILLISARFDTLEKIQEVLVCDRKFFKNAVKLEQFESEVGQ